MLPPSNNRLAEIEDNIRRLKTDVAYGLIEIGKNLIEAKSLVKHGEWSSWLENNVGFTQRTAQNYMKLARTFSGKEEIVSELEATKLFLLQEVPQDKRERFLAENDVANMTVKEMKESLSGDVTSKEDDSIWSIFDKVQDDQLYRVPVRLLKPIERYEEFFGPRIGEEYIEYLNMMKYLYESYEDKPALRSTVLITRDYTVLDEQEIVRAYRDLGIEEINDRYATLDSKVRIKGMTIEEQKIYLSLILHIGRGMDAGRIKLTDSMKKFRAEMLQKGIDVFEYLDDPSY